MHMLCITLSIRLKGFSPLVIPRSRNRPCMKQPSDVNCPVTGGNPSCLQHQNQNQTIHLLMHTDTVPGRSNDLTHATSRDHIISRPKHQIITFSIIFVYIYTHTHTHTHKYYIYVCVLHNKPEFLSHFSAPLSSHRVV